MMKNSLFLILIFSSSAGAWSITIDLGTAERLAVESSADIRHGREQIRLAALRNRLDIRSFLPGVEVRYSSGRQINIHAGDSDSVQLGLTLTQPLFDGGRSIESGRLAEIQLGIESAALSAGIEEIRDRVWQMFYGLLLKRKEMELQKELLDISIRQLSVTSKKYEVGAITELDYLDASIGVRGMELDVADSEIENETMTQDFAVLLGFEHRFFDDNPLELEGSLDGDYTGLPLFERDFRFWAQRASVCSPELIEKRFDLERVKTQYELSKRTYIPSVSIEASLIFSGTALPLQDSTGSLSLKATFPFEAFPAGIDLGGGFQRNRQKSVSEAAEISILPDMGFVADRQEAKLGLRITTEELADSETALSRSVCTNLRELEHRRLRLEVRRRTLRLQKKRLDILESRNALGKITEAELLEARIEYYGEETGILEEVMELIQSERAFEKLTGTGFGKLAMICASIDDGSAPIPEDE